MKKGKGEKTVNDEPDNSSLFGCMKDEIKINGDIFSTGAWPTDEEMIQSYNEQAADTEGEAEALEWIEGTAGDVGDEPW
ncbi:MAG: hypothetical protein ABIP78_13660 [Pyrinomonadaceae bacterium]